MLAFLDPLYPGFELLIVADRNGTGEGSMVLNIRQMMLPAEFRGLPRFDQFPEHALLVFQGRSHPLSDLLVHKAGKRTGQEGFYLHESGRVEQQIYRGSERKRGAEKFFSHLS